MQLIIHRGSHQIGGMSTEIRTASTRIIIDMGDELSLEDDFVSGPLDIPGVTDDNGTCDAILITHYHGDHTKQLNRARSTIPIFAGALTKEIMLISEQGQLRRAQKYGTEEEQKETKERIARIKTIKPFTQGIIFSIGDIRITPFTIDHSAIDAYMFLIEADGKRLLFTGDFRTSGFRGKGLRKILKKYIHHCDVLMTEGTALTRQDTPPLEMDLQRILKYDYIPKYKYIYILTSSTNMDRIFSASNAVPKGKYFICDKLQFLLIKKVKDYCGRYSKFYKKAKVTKYKEDYVSRFIRRGFVMMVRANSTFKKIIEKFDPTQSIILYSMWNGYRTKKDSTIPEFLKLADKWEYWHTSGHATIEDIKMVVEMTLPKVIIPMHTDAPEKMKEILPDREVFILQDKEVYTV